MNFAQSPIAGRSRLACCDTGRALGAAFLTMKRKSAAREAALSALADWALHLIDVHGEQGVGFPSCGICPVFGGAARGGMDEQAWAAEGRVHRVVHALDMELTERQDKE